MFRPAPLLFFTRKISFNVFSNWTTKCEKIDCTKPTEPPGTKYVIEKSCAPSIFEIWKPKIPDLRDLMNQRHNKITKICEAGMKPPKSNCQIQTEAKECQKSTHPKWLGHCLPKPKQDDGPLPVLAAALKQCKKNKGKLALKAPPKSLRKMCAPKIPVPDWNIDGVLD